MKKANRKSFWAALWLLTAFVLWTAAVCTLDRRPIGPQGSVVGLAALNSLVHRLTGVHMSLYHLTDWLGLVPLCFAVGFGLLGLVQWVKRRSLGRVDRSILALGGFYLVVMEAYLFFEQVVINYRPVLIDGILEASYPSSTTMLVLCIMPTAVIQLNGRIQKPFLKRCTVVLLNLFTVFMVVGRFASGVHWVSDIVGGALLSAALVAAYRAVVKKAES